MNENEKMIQKAREAYVAGVIPPSSASSNFVQAIDEAVADEPLKIHPDNLWAISNILAQGISGEVRYVAGDELAMAHQRIANLEDAMNRAHKELHELLGVG